MQQFRSAAGIYCYVIHGNRKGFLILPFSRQLVMAYKKQLTPEQALQKLRHYCAYQERCHYEVKEKLYSLGLRRHQVGECLSQLIEEDYLNEERFAAAFARGRFRMKQWGRIKIKYELKQKQVSEYCIKKAFGEIDEQQYLETLSKLAAEKYKALKGEPSATRKKKTVDYLLQKGFERELISPQIEKWRNSEPE